MSGCTQRLAYEIQSNISCILGLGLVQADLTPESCHAIG